MVSEAEGLKAHEFGLAQWERQLIAEVLARHTEITGAVIFGSRAKGTHRASSDIDLALLGTCDLALTARVADELEELPLPYRFDVLSLSQIEHEALLEHIQRVGAQFYP